MVASLPRLFVRTRTRYIVHSHIQLTCTTSSFCLIPRPVISLVISGISLHTHINALHRKGGTNRYKVLRRVSTIRIVNIINTTEAHGERVDQIGQRLAH